VKVCNDKYEAYVKANTEFEVSYAKALMAYDGPGYKAKYAAVIATEELRTKRDVADVAYKYAKYLAKALQDDLRAWQSVNKSVQSAYSAAGAA
jgi:hypothetical protein